MKNFQQKIEPNIWFFVLKVTSIRTSPHSSEVIKKAPRVGAEKRKRNRSDAVIFGCAEGVWEGTTMVLRGINAENNPLS